MKNLILLLIVTIFFTACSESSLDLDSNNRLVLKQNSKSYTLSETALDSESIGMFHLDVKRVHLRDSFFKPLFYEKVTTHNDYEIKYSSLETLQHIFKVSGINIVYESSSLLFVQLEREKYYINLIAETSSMTELSYVYGFSNRDFYEVASALGIKADTLKIKNTHKIENFESYWIREEHILHPLVDFNAGWGS